MTFGKTPASSELSSDTLPMQLDDDFPHRRAAAPQPAPAAQNEARQRRQLLIAAFLTVDALIVAAVVWYVLM